MTRGVGILLIVVPSALAVACAFVLTRRDSSPSPPSADASAPIPELPRDLASLDPRVEDLVRSAYAATTATPENADAWMQYGLALHANEYYERAAIVYRSVVTLDPTRPRAWYLLGRVATRLGRPDEALAAFGEVVSRDGRYAPALWRQGMLRLELGQPEAAAPLFERAVAIEGPYSAGSLGLARAWMANGRVVEAIAALEQYLAPTAPSARIPNAGYASNLLSTAYRRAGRIDDALRTAASGGDARPRWPDPWEEALAEHRPGYGARIDEARAFIVAGRRNEAIVALEALRHDYPGNVTVLTNLGLVYRQSGRFPESVATLLAALKLDGGFFLAHFQLAVVYAQMSSAADPPESPTKLRTQARRHLNRTLELNPTYASAHSLHGDLARLDAQPARALAHYREAARCNPLDARWPFRVGVSLLALERWHEATATLAKAAEMNPRDTEVRRGQAVAAMNLGLFDDADRALDAAVAIAPEDERLAATRRQLEDLRKRAGGEKRP